MSVKPKTKKKKINPRLKGLFKQCAECFIVWPTIFFNKNNATTDKLNTYCKSCSKHRTTTFRKNHKQKPKVKKPRAQIYIIICTKCGEKFGAGRNQSLKNSYCVICKPIMKEVTKTQHKLNHPEKYKDYSRSYRGKNKETQLKKSREWTKKNKVRKRILTNNRRARIREAEGFLTVEDWEFILKSQGYKCYDCGASDKTLTIGHAIPIARGGTNWGFNIIAQCQPCNSHQGSSIHPTYKPVADSDFSQRAYLVYTELALYERAFHGTKKVILG